MSYEMYISDTMGFNYTLSYFTLPRIPLMICHCVPLMNILDDCI